jgi:hypothetical protein
MNDKSKLFAIVNRDGYVTGVSAERFPDPAGEPDPRGNRELPLHGAIPEHDPVTEVLIGPSYHVAADRVVRSYTVRPKTAAELLAEISWWFAAVHANDDARASYG